MSDSYPRKYWWVILIVVPIAGGLIGIMPSFFGGSDNGGNRITITDSDVDGNVQIIGTQVILNQLKQNAGNKADMGDLEDRIRRAVNLVEGGFYQDAISLFEEIAQKVRSPAVYNNLGTLYLLDNQDDKAREAFKEGFALDPSYQPLRVNLARLYEKEGKLKEAKNQLEKAPDEAEAKTRLVKLKDKSANGLFEQEPNNDILGPNITPLSKNVLGSIGEQGDTDFFKFKTPPPPRDMLRIEVKNLSTSLKLRLQLWGADKRHLWSNASYGHQVTDGQDVRYTFSALPDTVYYLSVASLGGKGPYQLTLSPIRAFDSHEPNDDILSAKDIDFSSPVIASLMDEADNDYYRIRSGGNTVTVSLKNSSTNLQPQLQIWQGDKSHRWTNATYGHQVTPGQDVKTSFETEVGGTYYVSVASLGGRGNYTLTLTQPN